MIWGCYYREHKIASTSDCCITYMFFVKIPLDDPRLTLTTPKKASHIRNELLLIVSTLTSHGIALYVLIEHLVRIQLRTVSREEEQPHLFPLSGSPRLHLGTPVDRMTIEDQKHHALALADQPLEEIDQHFGREAFLKDHEVELPSVGEPKGGQVYFLSVSEPKGVEYRAGCCAVGLAYLFPSLSSDGA